MSQNTPVYARNSFFLASDGRLHLAWRIFLGCLAFVGALRLGVFVRSLLPRSTGELAAIGLTIEDFLKAVITASLVLASVYLLRRFADQRSWSGLGLTSLWKGFPFLLLSCLLVALAAGLTLGIFLAAGWVRIRAFQPDIIVFVIVILLQCTITFLFEPLPEEVLFRGYLYRNLNSRFPHWLAMPLQTLFFVLVPLILFAIEWVTTGSASFPFGGPLNYILTLVSFAFILQLSRIITGNLWTSIGVHIMALTTYGYFTATQSYALIQIEYQSGFEYLEHLYIACFCFLGCILLLIWQYLRKIPFNWKERISDVNDK